MLDVKIVCGGGGK